MGREPAKGFITEGETDPKKMTAGPFLPPPDFEQNQQEFYWMVAQFGRVSSYLEIGSREGGMLRMISRYVAPEGRICTIDIGLQHPEWQNGRATLPFLRETVASLRGAGFDARAYIGDSGSQEAVAWARDLGPFDLVFVDADHSYEAVRRDWENYSQFAKTIGFHDITMSGVCDLWAEIKARGATTDEMIATGGTGIGLVKLG